MLFEESIQFVTPQDIENFKATKTPNVFERRLIDTLEQEWARRVAVDDVTEDDVEAVEAEVGMGHGAWDMINPKDIITACRKTWRQRTA